MYSTVRMNTSIKTGARTDELYWTDELYSHSESEIIIGINSVAHVKRFLCAWAKFTCTVRACA